MNTLIIHSNQLDNQQKQLIEETFSGKLTAKNNHFRLETASEPSPETMTAVSAELKKDINLLPNNFNGSQVRLLISDMDSTLIGIECIDEIADMMNLKPEVAAITEAAMRGDIDFEGSLTQRVKLLTGLETSALEKVYQERLYLNQGAEGMITGLKQNDVKFALVSGGFTFFTERLQTQLGLDFTRANVLAEENAKLTGKVVGGIIGAKAKADFLYELCEQLKITPQQVIAIGDGANDLLMMHEAGLSIAYRAKPAVQLQAKTVFNYSSLEAVLDFIG
jgi:phosphoserine phosphatase